MDKQAAQKEVVGAWRKKKAEVAHRKCAKEKEVARRVKVGEDRANVELELQSEDSTEVDDTSSSEGEESREVVVTSVKRRSPTTMSAGD